MITVRSAELRRDDADGRAEIEQFLRTARERFRLAAEAEQTIRELALEDLKFYAGAQWPDSIVRERERAERPCLTINRLVQFVRQITNDERQARPAIQVNPADDGDVELAEIFQGLLRHIEVASDAEIAYDTAFESAVIGGFGYFRVITDYAGDDTVEQEIRIERIQNPFSVYFDPAARKPGYADARYAFIVEDIPRIEYKARYPDSELCGLSDFRSIGDGERDWFREGNIRVAEYFHVKPEKQTLLVLADGRTVLEDKLRDDDQIALDTSGHPITREVQVPRVKWAKINAREILEQTDWPGKYVPIIPVLGEELIVDGKRILAGIIRHAKDSQRQYNYSRSALVEAIALAPKAPWVAAEGQLEGYEDDWKASNRRNIAVLHYKPVSLDGTTALPAPHRNVAEAPISDLTVAVAQADNDMKATTGIYDAALGSKGPQESGRAILARQKESDVANFAFIDNLSRSIRHLGRLLVDLAPKIYREPGRLIRIVRPDQTQDAVRLNQAVQVEPNVVKFYDLAAGKYDVTVSVGPGYESKRQEFVQSVLTLVQSAPQIAGFIMDLVVRHMDWPGADEIADRLKKALPAGLQEPEKGAPNQQQIPPEVQQKIEALMQQHAALVEQLNQANSVLETRRMELESREKIAAIQAQTQLVVAQLKTESAEEIELLRQEIAALNKRLEVEQAPQPSPAAPQTQEEAAAA